MNDNFSIRALKGKQTMEKTGSMSGVWPWASQKYCACQSQAATRHKALLGAAKRDRQQKLDSKHPTSREQALEEQATGMLKRASAEMSLSLENCLAGRLHKA